MQVRVGADLVYLPRFRNVWGKIQDEVFSPYELKCLKNSEIERIAGVFAAKEAVIKALDLKAGSWLSIEVSNLKSGKK